MTILSEPRTREEWQQAANAAHALLALESSRLYGLVSGGPTVHVARCVLLLERAADQGIAPEKEVAVDTLVAGLRSV